ncbi:MAG: flippase-like domain-containing protein [Thermomicrobium sp.]|nr:flippase-like domain-containing protein [Thermomicrobium sp.]
MSAVSGEQHPRQNAGTLPANAEPTTAAWSGRRALWRGALGAAVLGAVVGIVVWRGGVDLRRALAELAGAHLGYVATALACYYGSFPLRSYRWSLILRALARAPGERQTSPPLSALLRFYLYGWLVNCILPAKLGEIYRAYLAHRRTDLPLATVLGTVFVERTLDLAVLACLLPALVFALGIGNSIELVSLQLTAGALSLASLVGLLLLRKSARTVRRLPALLQRPAAGLAAGLALGSRPFFEVTLLTVPLWVLEGLRVYTEARALGIALALPLSFLIALLAALLTTLPLTPAGIGAVELGIAATLLLLGFPSEQAIALALLDRLVAYWSVFPIAGVPWVIERVRGN